jgi:transposase
MKSAQYDRKYPAVKLIESFGPDTSHIAIGSALNVGRSTVYKWVQRQIRFNAYEADTYAIRVGLHPCEIWDDWFILGLEETA